MRRLTLVSFRMLLLLSMLVGSLSSSPASAAEPYCPQSLGLCIEGRFLEYWQQHGGLAVFGYPTTMAVLALNRDTGEVYLTQWFERARFELHPGNAAPYDVLLGRLGDDLLLKQSGSWKDMPRDGGPRDGCLWFEQTRINVCDQATGVGFKTYWQSHGLEFDGRPGFSYAESLALFGLPLTMPHMVTNSSGDTVLTQWFERARFEWHPSQPDEFKVLLGLLGNETLVALQRDARHVRSLAVSPNNPQRLYALTVSAAHATQGADARLLVSNDAGATWAEFEDQIPPSEPNCVRTISTGAAGSEVLYAVTCHGILKWERGSWNHLSDQPGLLKIASVPGQTAQLWGLGLPAEGVPPVVFSADEGRTWSDASHGLVHFTGLADIEVDPVNPSIVYSVIRPRYGGSYLRRKVGAELWQEPPVPGPIDDTLGIDPVTGELYIAYIGPGRSQLMKSSNPRTGNVQDLRWEEVGALAENQQAWPNILAVAREGDHATVYVSFDTTAGISFVQRSSDNGRTWTPLRLP